MISAFGKVETGILRPGMNVRFAPNNLILYIKSIEINYEFLEEALPGYTIAFNVKRAQKGQLKRGDVASDPEKYPAWQASGGR